MIRNIVHRGLRMFWETGSTRGITPAHERRLRIRLDAMSAATQVEQINKVGWNFHKLKGERQDTYSIHVNGPWCLTFKWDEEQSDIYDVDYENYH